MALLDVSYQSSKELKITFLCVLGKKYLYQQGCQWVLLLSVLRNTLGEMDVACSGEVKVSKFLGVPWCCGSHSLLHPPLPIALRSQHLQ